MTENICLSLEVAKTLMAQYRAELTCPSGWGQLDLSMYSQIDPPALQYLASEKIDGVVIFGLRHLDVMTAQAIAGAWNTHYVFSERIHLPPDVATILAYRVDGLVFENVPELSIESARALAKTQGQLHVGGLKELTMDMAEVLAGHIHELFVSVVTKPPMSAQRALLLSHAGYWVHLSFPDDAGPSAVCYAGNVKTVETGSYSDEAGRRWAGVVATEEIVRWRLRQEVPH